MMTIHKEGYKILASTLAIIIFFIVVINILWSEQTFLHYFAYFAFFVIFILILQFFRYPIFEIKTDDNCVLCPADGKIVAIEEVEETEYLKDKRIQISVFMSPLNVHVNRYPISGIVKYVKYHPGLYLVAWHPKSSTDNERTTIVVENTNKIPVLFRQIAGAVARRIVYYSKEGETVKQGSDFGFIKFGSRVDIFVPVNAKINVKIDEVVKGGKTILATL